MSPALVVALVLAGVLAPVSARADGAPSPPSSPSPSSPWHFTVDLPLVLTAQPPPSNVDTVQVPWLAVRAGLVDNVDGGGFVGGEGVVAVSWERQGTAQVGGGRLPLLVEGRGRAGGRWRAGLVGIGGYGVLGVGVGAGVALFDAFDTTRVRGFLVSSARVGGGIELSYLRLVSRVELLGGLRDFRPEVTGTFGVGLVF
jgi:hypothetical protein